MLSLGGRNLSSLINIKPVLSFNKKTGKPSDLVKVDCSVSERTTTKNVSDITIEVEGLRKFS